MFILKSNFPCVSAVISIYCTINSSLYGYNILIIYLYPEQFVHPNSNKNKCYKYFF